MSSGFLTEAEAAEARKRRQEEWENVRTTGQPLERPEEPYDGRSLYDRLKDNKMKKDLEYEEAHKLKNLVRGLDDDEVEFLELVDKSKIDAEQRQIREEEHELKEFRDRVATLQKESVDKARMVFSWGRPVTEELITLLKINERLWDTITQSYSNRENRKHALNAMQQQLSQLE